MVRAHNFCMASGISDSVCAMLGIEPNSDGTRVEHNVVTGNGGAPASAVPPPLAVDLASDGTGSGNCWQHNVAGTQFPAPLPTCR